MERDSGEDKFYRKKLMDLRCSESVSTASSIITQYGLRRLKRVLLFHAVRDLRGAVRFPLAIFHVELRPWLLISGPQRRSQLKTSRYQSTLLSSWFACCCGTRKWWCRDGFFRSRCAWVYIRYCDTSAFANSINHAFYGSALSVSSAGAGQCNRNPLHFERFAKWTRFESFLFFFFSS